MRIAVTGREGQVARSLAERAAERPEIELIAVSRPDLDLAAPETIAPALAAIKPDLIISAAAYTAVDQAEDEPDKAYAVNADGAGKVAEAAARLGVPIIHLSTDYVFDGTGEGDYREDAQTGPQGVYGASKLAGERRVAEAQPKHLILRTAWVYSPFGKNFVKTMLRLAGDRDEIAVVSDQWGNPTSALDIADGILHAAALLQRNREFAGWGVYHLAGTGATNWSGFARHILDTSARHGGATARVREIATAEYPTRARRPGNSRLSTDKLSDIFGWRAPDWRQSTDEVVRRLMSETTGQTRKA
ncbi:MAG TPA: dTDP-4-dehydrorhamnose reductase [Rhizobiaceae bacterium]|nr:dTDP-4-dehydrorhamnose reductase [Rhizobiaceae bacterium]